MYILGIDISISGGPDWAKSITIFFFINKEVNTFLFYSCMYIKIYIVIVSLFRTILGDFNYGMLRRADRVTLWVLIKDTLSKFKLKNIIFVLWGHW